MPRSKSTSDIPHVTMTDHQIPRLGDSINVPEAENRSGDWLKDRHAGGRRLLVPFHRDLMTTAERNEASRELAIAYSREGAAGAAMALPWLEMTLVANPDDVPAWQAKGVTLGWVNRSQEAMNAFQTALKIAPDRESLLKEAAQSAELAGAAKAASGYWQRAIGVNPWRSDYRAALARLCVETQDWPDAVAACREVIRLNPANIEVRQWLVESYLRTGNLTAAQAEQKILLGFGSPERSLPSR
jgi:tetratricopeptide (TPR) repeat protein